MLACVLQNGKPPCAPLSPFYTAQWLQSVCFITAGLLQSVCLLLQYLLQSCSRGGGGGMEDMCYERLRAKAGVN